MLADRDRHDTEGKEMEQALVAIDLMTHTVQT